MSAVAPPATGSGGERAACAEQADPKPMLKSPMRTPLKQLRKLLAGDSKTQCHRILPDLCKDPRTWGIKVQKVLALQEYIQSDMESYCGAHDLGMDFAHLCHAAPCAWHHHGAACRPKTPSEPVRSPMRPNMHTVVRRYVAPWTEPLGVSYSSAVVADTAARTIQSEKTLRGLCTCEVFISHCWNEPFADFCSTLRARLDADTTLWICSLGINQNANIGAEIGGGLYDVPFALALKNADRVLVVMDPDAEPLTRAWCVLEAHFAFTWDKAYDIALPSKQNSVDEAAWQVCNRRLSWLDIRECCASYHEDLVRILSFVEGNGGVEALNSSIRETGARASARAAALAAAADGRVDILRSLPAESLDVADSRGRTLLHYAAAQNHAEVVSLVVDSGVGVDRLDKDGRTALSVAAEAGAEACCWRLLGHGASPRIGEDLLPLHYAAVCGSTAVAGCLLQAAAEVDARSDYGRTPLYYASMVHDVPMMQLMLERRAVTDQKNKAGFLPLHIAVQAFRKEDVPGTVNDIARGSAAEVVALLCSHGVSMNAKTSDGRTPTMIAADAGQTSTLRALIESRADPGISNKKNHSPLHLAAQMGHCKCVQILVGARADIDQLTSMGSSPLKMAVAGGTSGRVAACRLLLELRADPNAGRDVLLPLHTAAKEGRVEILRALVARGADPALRAGKRNLPALALAACGDQVEAAAELLARGPLLAVLEPSHARRYAECLAPALAAAAQALLPTEGENRLQEDGPVLGRASDFVVDFLQGAWQACPDAAKDSALVDLLVSTHIDTPRAEVGKDEAWAEARAWDDLMLQVDGCLQACGARATAAGLLYAARRGSPSGSSP